MLLLMTESGDTDLIYTGYQGTYIDEFVGIPLYADLYVTRSET